MAPVIRQADGRRTRRRGALAAALWTVCLAATAALGQAKGVDYDKLVKSYVDRLASARKDHRGRYRSSVYQQFEKLCLKAARPGAEAERAAVCKAILPHLGSRTPKQTRADLLRMLEQIGRAECIFTLDRLLGDSDAETREQARRALQNNPSAEAAAVLRRALDAAKDAPWQVALINALGYRRDAPSVAKLGQMLDSKDPAVGIAAAAALGKIGGPQAARLLNTARVLNVARAPAADPNRPSRARMVVADALLACADRSLAAGDKQAALDIYRTVYGHAKERKEIRIAALHCLVAALGSGAMDLIEELLSGEDEELRAAALALVRQVPGEAATKAVAAMAARAAPKKKPELLAVLGDRGDPAARPTVLNAVGSPEETVRVAAIKALGSVGSAEDVPVLAELIIPEKTHNERATARAALQRLRGEGVNRAILAYESKASSAAVRSELIRCLGARKAVETVPALLKMLSEGDAAVRPAVLDSVAMLADEKALDMLIAMMAEAKDASQLRAAERAVLYACGRSKDKETCGAIVAAAIPGKSVAVRCALLRACAYAPGEKTLTALRAALKDADPSVRDTALRVLADSRDPRAAADLLKLARAETDKARQALAVQGYIRMIERMDQPSEEKLWMYVRAMDVAKRPEEKRLALMGMRNHPSLGALTLVMEHLQTPDLQQAASYAAARIGYDIARSHPAEVRAAMQRVLKVAKETRTVRYAQQALDRAKATKSR